MDFRSFEIQFMHCKYLKKMFLFATQCITGRENGEKSNDARLSTCLKQMGGRRAFGISILGTFWSVGEPDNFSLGSRYTLK